MRLTARLPGSERRASVRTVERTNEKWIEMLGTTGPRQHEAIRDLRLILLRGLRYGLAPRLRRRGAAEQIEDFAQDAILKILENLDSFRGESLFTTWAQKIALRIAFSEMRRKRWENVSLDQLLEAETSNRRSGLDMEATGPGPVERTSAVTALETVESIIDASLTDLQRRALTAIILHDMPMEEVARSLGTNRNALYKLLHDARKKVSAEVSRRGIGIDELISHL